MQLTITQPSVWFSASAFKPFLLIGVAGLSSIAFYSSTSSKNNDLQDKFNSTLKTITEPLSPFTDKLTGGTTKLFEKLEGWTKSGSNYAAIARTWASKKLITGNVPNGAKQMFATLKGWGETAYGFLKDLIKPLLSEDPLKKLREYAPMLGNILSLFSNMLKADMSGDTSLLSELFKAAGKEGFGDFFSAFQNLASKKPDVFSQMNSQDVSDLVNSFNANQKQTTQVMQEFADKPIVKKQDLMNALKPSTLMGKIEAALEEAKEFKAKEHSKLSEEEKQRAKAVYDNLKKLSEELNSLIQQAKKNK
ncbi:hypothetical protein A6V39_01055 [Candidatus Mycoplasma haematobovis]|uniref:Uncharacterized protein n=1 Tax=Candidatus Mycoplasma haematobovis TaxID=432608 RepID=A0A1A9QF53_9MOLU|nr:hypothetical protein [Candidatus Mycoplasma haematobovis]OAL10641.1 hypothetical protein A6V39_01055 [Candidatus Mycoplasma haematobovis]